MVTVSGALFEFAVIDNQPDHIGSELVEGEGRHDATGFDKVAVLPAGAVRIVHEK